MALRTFCPAVRDQLERGLRQIAEGVAQSHGVELSFEFRRGYPPTVNTVVEAELCAQAARAVAGDIFWPSNFFACSIQALSWVR